MEQELKQEYRKIQSSIAMTVVLVSWVMFFATLFLAYALYRITANVWPPMGFENISLNLPTLSMVVIILSSISYEVYRKVKSKHYLTGTLVLGLGFLVSQLYLWDALKLKGIYVEAGIFPSIIYAFTWIHAAHIGLGIISLVTLYFIKKENIEIWNKNVGTFWHFLGIIWFLMYATIFVI